MIKRQIITLTLALAMVCLTLDGLFLAESFAVNKDGWAKSQTGAYTGWKVFGKHKKYLVKGEPVKGLYKIGKAYYFFNKKGYMKKGEAKAGNILYYLDDFTGKLRVTKAGGKLYYTNGKEMTSEDKRDWRTFLRAKALSKEITKPGWSKSRKLLACTKWVQKHHYSTRRKFDGDKTVGWPSIYANDLFVRTAGNCHSDAAALGYLAAAIGYDKVYICSDARYSNSAHSWTEINGLVIDPLFAEVKGFSRFYMVPYSRFTLSVVARHRLPYYSPSHAKKGNNIIKKKNRFISRWSDVEKKLYYNTGEAVTGIAVYKDEFYAFNPQGVYDSVLTSKLRKLAKKDKSFATLKEIIGEPLQSTYTDSCKAEGKDGLLKYKNFTVMTFKGTKEEKELFVGIFENK